MKNPVLLLLNDIHASKDNLAEFTANWNEALKVCAQRGIREIAVGGDMFQSRVAQTLDVLLAVNDALLRASQAGILVTLAEEACMRHIEAKYEQDAYNSLSIEGYRVTDELIEKVRSGNWQPDKDASDAEQRNAMAARGYWQTFQAVKQSAGRILEGANPGEVVESDHRAWYRELFAPSVTAGLIRASDLAGYRIQQVYIRDSLHTPLNPEVVRDAMPAFFELLRGEPDAGVRAVLGHFVFVYIHPYMDGNGRIARFLMNAMLISGGYDWTVVPLERRKEYMAALEKASVEEDITDFARFLGELV